MLFSLKQGDECEQDYHATVYIYVEDAADVILLAAEHYDDSIPVNLGSGEEISIETLVKTIGNLTGFQGTIHCGIIQLCAKSAIA